MPRRSEPPSSSRACSPSSGRAPRPRRPPTRRCSTCTRTRPSPSTRRWAEAPCARRRPPTTRAGAAARIVGKVSGAEIEGPARGAHRRRPAGRLAPRRRAAGGSRWTRSPPPAGRPPPPPAWPPPWTCSGPARGPGGLLRGPVAGGAGRPRRSPPPPRGPPRAPGRRAQPRAGHLPAHLSRRPRRRSPRARWRLHPTRWAARWPAGRGELRVMLGPDAGAGQARALGPRARDARPGATMLARGPAAYGLADAGRRPRLGRPVPGLPRGPDRVGHRRRLRRADAPAGLTLAARRARGGCASRIARPGRAVVTMTPRAGGMRPGHPQAHRPHARRGGRPPARRQPPGRLPGAGRPDRRRPARPRHPARPGALLGLSGPWRPGRRSRRRRRTWRRGPAALLDAHVHKTLATLRRDGVAAHQRHRDHRRRGRDLVREHVEGGQGARPAPRPPLRPPQRLDRPAGLGRRRQDRAGGPWRSRPRGDRPRRAPRRRRAPCTCSGPTSPSCRSCAWATRPITSSSSSWHPGAGPRDAHPHLRRR